MKIIYFLSIVLAALSSRSFAGECEPILSHQEFRVWQSWLCHYFGQHECYASMQFDRAVFLTIEPANPGVNVISFGSGPDLFTPIANFPLAQNVHLVDHWGSWGKGSGDVVNEAVQRMWAIHPTAKLRLVDLGFLRHTPENFQRAVEASIENRGTPELPPELLEFDFFKSPFTGGEQMRNEGFNHPLVVDVSWEQEQIGLVHRQIFLHFMDYNDDECIAALKKLLRENGESLAGVVVTGTQFPKNLRSYVDRLPEHGSAVLEVFSDDEAQEQFVAELKQDPRFKVELAFLKTNMRRHQDYLVKFQLYVLTRVKKALEPKK